MATLGGVNGTVCNAHQYEQSLPSLINPDPSISCLTHGQSIGLALTAEASFISFASVIVVFILIGVRTLALRANILRYRKALPNGDWKLLQVPTDIYMLSLFAFDILQAIGGIFDVRWAHNGIVNTGPYCTAQGIIQQIGELGVGLVTLIIAVHTFVTALWRVGHQARWFAFGVVALTCVFLALWAGIGNGLHKNYEVPTPYWCWIGPRFKSERLAGEYIWLWIALFASLIMYIPLYFWAEGRLSVDDKKWYMIRLYKSDEAVEYSQRRAALGMLFYPLAYSVVVLPLSAARWSMSNDKKAPVPSAATFFAVIMFNLSGAINVLLFLTVRPRLLLFTPPEEHVEPEIELTRASNGSGIFPDDTTKYNHSPKQNVGVLGSAFEGSRNSITMSRVSSRQRFEDI
ncbi:hypothetical protein B0F90DRAFT_1624778 [Multifurca ochricompacta]|uniref:Glucose receptor Git3 N-terminal domain-containing protein n=1 Tax=Multifurca ochricompacta TaxID=376703 RepID=A0AAD4MAP0_9AGAM|nr:hypothetical protein B0F90DRAFT_1624778 [Multifurca ochricompacta]